MSFWTDQWREFIEKTSYMRHLRERGISNDQFWREYEIYDEILGLMGYPGRILDRISSLIHPGSTVLDIGAGTGAFSIPLSRIAGRIIALDPSEHQLQILMRKARGIDNIKAICDRWPDAEIGDDIDYTLAAYSLFHEDIEAFLRRMIDVSHSGVFIVFRAEPPDPLTDFAYGPKPHLDYRCLQSILREMGYDFEVDVFPRDYRLPIRYVLKQYRYSERSPEEIIDYLRNTDRLDEDMMVSFHSSDALLHTLGDVES
ncbi:MAG: methyltransferase domain-containing protein [Methanothrix sp.]|jgi:ubiquinone/menaquinone biosynthesis C-methylase UbiE|uniref:Methyltransferase type 12 n=1 Tax=Methanothrix thermoacetophila (strain DSM 6194 / JCM 14653 / NBRC 101360 / PT) TaxID=349307 RepID=A0B7Z7_METTP|nr:MULTISPECIES: class I SAM-dependent methyltransferase [Methanothrix]ABK14821.1 Methyltransferase type 12 [Methanothrix thermoacetophila PT]MBC7080347.1 methyltransferase domain-containing protein [Methanothrix sp.]NPU87005.1 methyltransferase domain-containing protein [Methanothrix sp.]